MKKVELSNGLVALVSDRDFPRVRDMNWWFVEGYAYGYPPDGSHPNGISMATFILGTRADHKNHDRLDNRRSNLRPANSTTNAFNHLKRCDNTSGYKGVSWDSTREVWEVYICVGRCKFRLGDFEEDELEEAARTYDEAARNIFGKFSCVNFPNKNKSNRKVK